MIIPDNRTLEEMIGAMKTELQTTLSINPTSDKSLHLAGLLNLAEAVKRELDGKAEKKLRSDVDLVKRECPVCGNEMYVKNDDIKQEEFSNE
jgi:hypothetical protein